MMYRHTMHPYRNGSSSAVLLSVCWSRARRWLLLAQHLVVHALDSRDSDTRPRPMVVDGVVPIVS